MTSRRLRWNVKKQNKNSGAEEVQMAVETNYPDFLTGTNYGKVDGLLGVNCR